MSTRKKAGKAKGFASQDFVKRSANFEPVRQKIMLYVRLYREALAIGEATSEMWTEIAALTNVGLLYAVEKNHGEWLEVLGPCAKAIITIQQRNERVGGRWIADKSELEAITAGINVLDEYILAEILFTDFVRLANKLNEGAEWL